MHRSNRGNDGGRIRMKQLAGKSTSCRLRSKYGGTERSLPVRRVSPTRSHDVARQMPPLGANELDFLKSD